MLSVVSNIYPLILGKIISIHSSQTLLTFSVNAANLLSLSHSSPWPHTLYLHLQYLLHRCTIKFNLISLFHFERRSFWSLYYDFPQPEQSGIGSQQTLFILLLFVCLYHLTFLTIHFIWCRHFKVQRQPKHQCANQQDPIMQVETRTAFLHGCSLQIPPFYTREAPLEPPTFYYWHRVQCVCSTMLSLCWSFCKRFGFLLLAVNFIMKIHLTRET